MPVQLFPATPSPSRRPRLRVRWWWFIPLAVLALIPLIGLTPGLLLNTDLGRTLVRAAANSTDRAHLGLSDSKLTYFPQVNLMLEGVRVVQPFEAEAPALAINKMALDGLSIESNVPGRPLICKQATLSGITAVVHQRWSQLHRGNGEPPNLPDYFPKMIIAPEVEIVDTAYTVHQLRGGRPTLMRMSGIHAQLREFEWDLAHMQVHGHGPFSAAQVEINDMTFKDMQVADFRADGSRLELPSARLTGMGGSVVISGEIDLQSGVPKPNFKVHVTDMDLASVIASRAPKTGRPGPTGRIYLEGRASSSSAEVEPGEVPEPVLEGALTLEDFALPLVQKSKLAARVLERLPWYMPGEPPRLKLGTMKGHVRVADGRIALTRLQVRLGGAVLTIEGTIEQGTGKLDLKLWADKATGADAAGDASIEQLEASQAESAQGDSRPRSGSDASTAPDLKSAAASSPAVEQDVSLSPSPAPNETPSSEAAGTSEGAGGLKARLKAKKEELDARAAALKRELDAHAEQAKKDFDARAEKVKSDIKQRVDAAHDRADARAEEIKAQVKERVEQLKSRIESRGEELRLAWEAKHGRPMLCITGTTAEPDIKLCRETPDE